MRVCGRSYLRITAASGVGWQELFCSDRRTLVLLFCEKRVMLLSCSLQLTGLCYFFSSPMPLRNNSTVSIIVEDLNTIPRLIICFEIATDLSAIGAGIVVISFSSGLK